MGALSRSLWDLLSHWDPLAPPALRGGVASCSASRKFLDLIHAINAHAFLRTGINTYKKWYNNLHDEFYFRITIFRWRETLLA